MRYNVRNPGWGNASRRGECVSLAGAGARSLSPWTPAPPPSLGVGLTSLGIAVVERRLRDPGLG